MNGSRGIGGSRPTHWQVLAMIAVMSGLGLLVPAAWTPLSAQSVEVGAARNAIGTLVVIRRDGIEERLTGKGALRLFEGDLLRTEAGSQALIGLGEGVQIALNRETSVRILARWEKTKGTTRIIRLRQGEIWVKTGSGAKLVEVETPVAMAVIANTEANIRAQADGQTTLTVVQGTAEFGTPFGACRLNPSAVSFAVRGKPCTDPQLTDAGSAIAWTSAVLK